MTVLIVLVSGFSGKFVNIAPAPVMGKPQMKHQHIQMGHGQQIVHMQDSQGRVRQVVKLMQVNYFELS